jgi:hypothetical protein
VSANLTYKKQITDAPMLVHSDDSNVLTYLAALPGPSFLAATQGEEWALPCVSDEIGGAGSAVLVSAASYRRIATRRIP